MHKLRNRTYLLMLIDVLAFECVFWVSVFAAKLSSSSVDRTLEGYLIVSFVLLVTIFAMRFGLSVYNNVWRYANSQAYLLMVIADTVGGGVGTAVCYYLPSVYIGIWQSMAIITAFSLVTLSMRFLYQQRYRHLNTTLETIHKIGVAIVGAGNTGARLAEDLLYTSKSRYKPICFIDVSKEKIGSRVCGVPVLPEDEEIVKKPGCVNQTHPGFVMRFCCCCPARQTWWFRIGYTVLLQRFAGWCLSCSTYC